MKNIINKNFNNLDTIIAQVTPYGNSGVGIIRISGKKTEYISNKILNKIIKPRIANYLIFRDHKNNILDKGIAIFFKKPYSFTGEDILELHCHGNPISLISLMNYIINKFNIRFAKPGEFSYRAFLNNKIDLIQAESIMDLINSNSKFAVKSSINSLNGNLSLCINNIIKEIIKTRIYIETIINFSEYETEVIPIFKISNKLNKIIKIIKNICYESKLGKLKQHGIKIVILGKPNSGKSTIFNLITKKNISIVTNIPGTTRDIIRKNIYINGIPIQIIDTAGLRKSYDIIEKIGIEKTKKEINNADHLLLVIDSNISKNYKIKELFFNVYNKIDKNKITIIENKIDIKKKKADIIKNKKGYNIIKMSALTGLGKNILFNHLTKISYFNKDLSTIFINNKRHIKILKKTLEYIKQSKYLLDTGNYIDIIANKLNLAQKEISKITGNFTTKDLLKNIFSKFCIGK
ncbi:tRNA uridine-5-carboxymethylaminomethyl(34) synthesis GTPase MnmE [Candidatus Annandia pinicola]|uniref:tRNA uridine-5-carboxymethylaminomethyl(34) synthesis GTPase MnmE n=1 Tax=Candidatus Annandia pinicola TaxID=1345117 RepID=UPI001D00D4EF|nr:tRNA uridine-5-carboxymethylaminomethyl(34) synthesis GTPase MnmE [Candidatus Annandia pinicola]UDG80512.1 tRNA modification GTPase MnmE [Candidatus Annandia pinicola]